jgi:hypothetical protein
MKMKRRLTNAKRTASLIHRTGLALILALPFAFLLGVKLGELLTN